MSTYFEHPALSNSKISEFEQQLSGNDAYDSTKAYRIGHLVDAVITEFNKLSLIEGTIEGLPHVYTKDEISWSLKMRKAFFADPVAAAFFKISTLQVEFYRVVYFEIGGQSISFLCKCKYDGFIYDAEFGWDLKSTAATTQAEFEELILRFNYDRAAFFYMHLSSSSRFCIIGVSKKNYKVFRVFITKGDKLWTSGRDKCLNLMQKYYLIHGNNTEQQKDAC